MVEIHQKQLLVSWKLVRLLERTDEKSVILCKLLFSSICWSGKVNWLENSEDDVKGIREVQMWPPSELLSPNHSTIKSTHLPIHRGVWIQGKHEEVGKFVGEGVITYPMVKLKSSKETIPHFNSNPRGKSIGDLENTSPKQRYVAMDGPLEIKGLHYFIVVM